MDATTFLIPTEVLRKFQVMLSKPGSKIILNELIPANIEGVKTFKKAITLTHRIVEFDGKDFFSWIPGEVMKLPVVTVLKYDGTWICSSYLAVVNGNEKFCIIDYPHFDLE